MDPIEDLFLHGNPNPDRIGCPPPGIVDSIARGTLPLDHPARKHLTQCSPCYSDFKARRSRLRIARIAVWIGAATIVLVCLSAVLAFWLP